MFPSTHTAFAASCFSSHPVLPSRASVVNEKLRSRPILCAMNSPQKSEDVPEPQALIRQVVNQMRDPVALAWTQKNIGSMQQWDSIDELLSQFPKEHELSQAYLVSQLDKQRDELGNGPCGFVLKRDDALTQEVFDSLKAEFGRVSEKMKMHPRLKEQLESDSPVIVLDQLSKSVFNHAIEAIYSRDFIVNRMIGGHIKRERSDGDLPVKILQFLITQDLKLLPAVAKFLLGAAGMLMTDRMASLQQKLLEVKGQLSSDTPFREALSSQKGQYDAEFFGLLDDIAAKMPSMTADEVFDQLSFDRYPNLSRQFCEKVINSYERLSEA